MNEDSLGLLKPDGSGERMGGVDSTDREAPGFPYDRPAGRKPKDVWEELSMTFGEMGMGVGIDELDVDPTRDEFYEAFVDSSPVDGGMSTGDLAALLFANED